MGLPKATLLLRAAAPSVKIVDVGAMSIGGKESPHVRLVKAGKASLVGFEPVAQGAAAHDAKALGTQRVLQGALCG